MSTVSPVATMLEPHARTFHELREAFEELEELVAQHALLSEKTASATRKVAEVCELRFRIEEDAPLLEDVQDKAPWLHEKASEFRQQHELLRRHLLSLCHCSQRQLPVARPWMELAEELAFFKRQLAAHEETECDFWQQIYSMDVGTKD